MTLLAATQIPKPADEQAFERASIVLWRGLLGDPSVQRNGRRGQRQNGVDLFGIRDGKPDWHVGIQCKLKSEGHFLSEDKVRTEVKKALRFKPPLREYFIVTTAPDDVAIQELARVITTELVHEGHNFRISIWGWNTLEEKISEDAAALKPPPSRRKFVADITHLSLCSDAFVGEAMGLRFLAAMSGSVSLQGHRRTPSPAGMT